MEIITSVEELQSKLTTQKRKKIGFVPTMGALHSGHIALVKKCIRENDISVCSIFVNPTQFNEKSDLKKYPRTLEADSNLLEDAKLDFLFAPGVKEIYPKGEKSSVKVNLDGLDRKLEGAFRPGHFDGVVQVVHRLLNIVKPHKLYMGQKDFQQFTIIQKMIDNLKMKVELVVCDIQRDFDGLALSSRNRRLTKSKRKWANLLYMNLLRTKELMKFNTVEEVENISLDSLGLPAGFKPEYFTIINGHTLNKVTDWKDARYLVALTAVWAGEVRLIDNVILKKTKKRTN